MKIAIESTDEVTTMDGVPVRVWNGVTESGVECFVFVHLVSVRKDADASAFERELIERPAPTRFRMRSV